MKPYNDSIFELRHKYFSIFPETKLAPIDNDDELDQQSIFKINYYVNLLPTTGEHVAKVKVGKNKYKYSSVNTIMTF